MQPINLAAAMLQRELAPSHQPALIMPPVVGALGVAAQITYGDLRKRVAQLRRGLDGLGLLPGDHVGMLSPLGVHFFALALALLASGQVLVFLNGRLDKTRALALLKAARPRAIVSVRQVLPLWPLLSVLWRTKRNITDAATSGRAFGTVPLEALLDGAEHPVPGAEHPTVALLPGAEHPTVELLPGAEHPTVALPVPAEHPTVALPLPGAGAEHPTVALQAVALQAEHGTLWRRTGDMARLDAEGRYWLTGRLPDRVTHRSRVLQPFVVEAALSETTTRRVAFVAHPGAPEGELALEVTAHERHAALSLAHGVLDCRGLLELPIRPVAAIPVDARHNSKIDSPLLRQQLARATQGALP